MAETVSVFLAHLLVTVLGIGDQSPVPGVHNEVEIFQGNLAELTGDVFTNIHHIEIAVVALDFQTHRFINSALLGAVRGLRNNRAHFFQPQRPDDAGFQIQPRGPGVREGFGFTTRGFVLESLRCCALKSNRLVSLILTMTLPRRKVWPDSRYESNLDRETGQPEKAAN